MPRKIKGGDIATDCVRDALRHAISPSRLIAATYLLFFVQHAYKIFLLSFDFDTPPPALRFKSFSLAISPRHDDAAKSACCPVRWRYYSLFIYFSRDIAPASIRTQMAGCTGEMALRGRIDAMRSQRRD